MAFLLQDLVIINDNRELIGVNTAGITTALYVGETIQLDAQSGVITATKFVGSGSSLTDLPAASFISTEAPTTRENGSPLEEGDLYYDSSVLRQFTRYDNDGDPIWVDSNPAASAAVLSVNVGVDTAIIDLSTEKLIFEGTTDEVTVGINTLTDTVTIGLPADVSIASTMSAAFFEGDGSKLTNVSGTIGPNADILTTGNIQAGIITATTLLEATGAGIGFTVTNNMYAGGQIEAGTGIDTPTLGLAGSLYIGVFSDSDNPANVDNTKLVTAAGAKTIAESVVGSGSSLVFTSLELTGPGIALTVSNDVSVGGSITAGSYYGDGSNLTGLQAGAATSVTSFDNQGNVDYPLPFLSAVGVGATIYTDSTANEELTYNPSTGTLKSKEFDALSDQRLKTNIVGITSALSKLEQLRGVEYDWVNGSGASVGVIAQEVQLVYPQLVSDTENRMTVNYNGLVGLLVQAVNELSSLLDEYKSK